MAWKLKKSGEKKEDSYLYHLSGDEDDRLRKEYDKKYGSLGVTRIPLKKLPVWTISYRQGIFHNIGIFCVFGSKLIIFQKSRVQSRRSLGLV